MIDDNVEKIIMTKEDYDRNVEQLLVDKCKAELEIERLHSIIKEVREYVSKLQTNSEIKTYDILDYEKRDILQILKDSDKEWNIYIMKMNLLEKWIEIKI